MVLNRTRRDILETTEALLGPRRNRYVADHEIAERLGLTLQQVRDYLNLLEQTGYVDLAKSHDGHAALTTSRGRMALQDPESIASEAQRPTVVLSEDFRNAILNIDVQSRAIGHRVDLLEIRLRNFIDHRLTMVFGLHYWKRTMPGDVITTVKQRIAEQLSRHPYEGPSQFALGRRRLNFCDVSHYEKIILKNWAQFEEFFQRKDEFQRHIAAYRTLRNCVQHNRQPSDIEQQLGEVAMMWLERILDQYEQEALAPSEEELTTTVVAGPSPEARQVGTQKKELAERHILRQEFWAQLLERAKERTVLHARRSPTTDNWLIAGAGKRGLAYRYAIRMGDAQVGLRIRRDTVEESKRIFDSLYANRDTIEQAFGDRLEWQRLDHQRTSHIRYVIPGGGLQNKDRWPEIQNRMIDAMVRLERALKPEIQRLK